MRAGLANLLFDLDGTLVDSSAVHASAFCEVLAVEAPELLATFDYEPLKGLTTADAFRKLGIGSEPQLARCVSAKQQSYRRKVGEGALVLLPGARAALDQAAPSGLRCFLVTSGSEGSVRAALQALGIAERFAGVVTSDDVSQGKPAAEPYLFCLRTHGLEASASIAIEDAPSGVCSARAAGLRVAGIGNPDIAAQADWFFADLAAFAAALAVPSPSAALS